MHNAEDSLKEFLASMGRSLESYKEALGALLSILEPEDTPQASDEDSGDS